jgi:hypothetical protein
MITMKIRQLGLLGLGTCGIVTLFALGCAGEETEFRGPPSSSSGGTVSGTGGSTSSTGGTTSDGTGGYADPGTGGTVSATGGTSSGACTTTVGAGASNGKIDDLEDNDHVIAPIDGRTGYWYTFNDKTGTQTPAPESVSGSPFLPMAGGANGSSYAAATSGSGFKTWGAGMGFTLNTQGTASCAFDASAYTGIRFWARGNGAAVRMKVTTPATTPTTEGGTCVEGGPGLECSNAHGKDFTPGAWQLIEVPFATLTQQEYWGQPAAFDKSKLLQVQFQIAQEITFDIAVDDLEFY